MGAVATHAINPWLYAKMPYDPIRDFTPITGVAQVPNVLVMSARERGAARHRERRRPRRLREEESGQAQLRLGRQRQRRPSRRRDVQGAGRRLHGPHPLRRRQPGAARAAGRPGRPQLRQPRDGVGQHQGRQAEGARGDDAQRSSAMPEVPTIAEAGAKLGLAQLRHRHLVRHVRARPTCRPTSTARLNKAFVDALASPELQRRLATLLRRADADGAGAFARLRQGASSPSTSRSSRPPARGCE